ncbi:MAG TPA: hypothetical protein PK967_20245 [Candidatus Hydrogenedentes bacterium]|nr:hypothetical protein [Candidatus Hydrogenedentota bacterium]
MKGKRTKDDLARLHGETVRRPARRPGFQPGNQHARKHGVFAAHFLDEDEKESFSKLRERFSEDYPSETAADETALDLVCVYLLRLGRAIRAGEVDYIVKLDGTVRNHLRDLKATRITREGDKPTGPDTTPAEWASSLLAADSGASRKAAGRRVLENAGKRSDNTGAADSDTPENTGDSDGAEA